MRERYRVEKRRRCDKLKTSTSLAASPQPMQASANDGAAPPPRRPVLPKGEQLRRACERGRADDALRLISGGADVNFADQYGSTPLMGASEEGLEAVAARLCSAGAALDAVNVDGWSALMKASRNGSAAIAQLLVDKGAKLDLVGVEGASALIRASSNGHAAIAQLLASRVDAVALNHIDSDGKTALDRADEGGLRKEKVAELAPVAVAIRARGGLTGAEAKALQPPSAQLVWACFEALEDCVVSFTIAYLALAQSNTINVEGGGATCPACRRELGQGCPKYTHRHCRMRPFTCAAARAPRTRRWRRRWR